VPLCKNPCCTATLKPWGCYFRGLRLGDGTWETGIPIKRWRCRVHGTTSAVPTFLHRYLHYAVAVVESVLVELAMLSGRVDTLVEIPGPSVPTVYRWFTELLSTPAYQWVQQRIRGSFTAEAWNGTPSPERARVLGAARFLASQLNSKVFSPILQRARLAHLRRYGT